MSFPHTVAMVEGVLSSWYGLPEHHEKPEHRPHRCSPRPFHSCLLTLPPFISTGPTGPTGPNLHLERPLYDF